MAWETIVTETDCRAQDVWDMPIYVNTEWDLSMRLKKDALLYEWACYQWLSRKCLRWGHNRQEVV